MKKSDIAQLVRLISVTAGGTSLFKYCEWLGIVLVSLFIISQSIRKYYISEIEKKLYIENPDLSNKQVRVSAIRLLPSWIKILPI